MTTIPIEGGAPEIAGEEDAAPAQTGADDDEFDYAFKSEARTAPYADKKVEGGKKPARPTQQQVIPIVVQRAVLGSVSEEVLVEEEEERRGEGEGEGGSGGEVLAERGGKNAKKVARTEKAAKKTGKKDASREKTGKPPKGKKKKHKQKSPSNDEKKAVEVDGGKKRITAATNGVNSSSSSSSSSSSRAGHVAEGDASIQDKEEAERIAHAREWDAVMREAASAKISTTGQTVIISPLETVTTASDSREILSKLVVWKQALGYLAMLDLSSYMSSIVVESRPPPRGMFGFLWRFCLGVQTLMDEGLIEERKKVFCFAKMPFIDTDEMHRRMLFSVYVRLTGDVRPVSRRGDHWETIGFQGKDPATDLRGCGMLALLQLLYEVEDNAENMGCIYRLSLDGTHGFPLSIISINITKWALESLRAGTLSKEINKQNSVVNVINQFHKGAFHDFYNRWKNGGMTMLQSGYLLKEVEEASMKRPSATLGRASTVLKDWVPRGSRSVAVESARG
ncbi:hypothetical protein CBR_g12225 [Chara braunii]|uniref:ELMO domain-containing protein n=1 Tax=Chara braunii TaxID=69332 RepID=A0A388KRF5_CHABU|nr:hypothetical protein CBR_g12225 [Chara braunii]|eukprot:GBG72651.1 hypothetical protein CBR_g12225 [Chara braunii]